MLTGLSQEIYEMKYKAETDTCWEDTCRRVVNFIYKADNNIMAADKAYDLMCNLQFVPGGRITEGSGTKKPYLLNCYALDIKDTIEDIYEKVKQTAVISKKNGGVGLGLSKIRPKDMKLSSGGVGSGPVSFMGVFNSSCSVIKTGSKNRRAALISILDIWHPDSEEYIDAKRVDGALENFNISVGITDAFVHAVEHDLDWDLIFNGVVFKTIKARYLWDKLAYSGWMYNDPGLILHDAINRNNSMLHKYRLELVNP